MKKKSMYNNAINLYNKLLKIYFKKYDPSNLLFLRYKFIESKKQNENKKKKKNHFQKKLLLKE